MSKETMYETLGFVLIVIVCVAISAGVIQLAIWYLQYQEAVTHQYERFCDDKYDEAEQICKDKGGWLAVSPHYMDRINGYCPQYNCHFDGGQVEVFHYEV